MIWCREVGSPKAHRFGPGVTQIKPNGLVRYLRSCLHYSKRCVDLIHAWATFDVPRCLVATRAKSSPNSQYLEKRGIPYGHVLDIG